MAEKINIFGGITLGGSFGNLQPVFKPLGTSMPQDIASALVEVEEGFVGSSFGTPIMLLTSQLVNGINYSILIERTKVIKDPVKDVVILTINIPFMYTGKGASIVKIISADEPDVPEAIQALFNQATSKLLGSTHKSIAFLGTQQVAGTLYYLITTSQTTRPGSRVTANLTKLWLKPDGTLEIAFDRIPKR